MSDDLISKSKLMKDLKKIHINVTGLRSGRSIFENIARQYEETVMKTILEQPTEHNEKEVAKKVNAKKYTYFKNSTRIKDKYGKCPICKSNQREDNYCGNCGQKLDWSEDELYE